MAAMRSSNKGLLNCTLRPGTLFFQLFHNKLFQEDELLVAQLLVIDLDDAGEHVAELVVEDLMSGRRDQVFDTAAASEPRPFAIERAIAAFGELAAAPTDGTMLG